MSKSLIAIVITSLLLAACSSAPSRPPQATPSAPVVGVPPTGGYLAGDGPDANVPENLNSIPDAVPHAEPLHRYANRPYKVLGQEYTPLTNIGNYKERGIASWYGKKFHGQRTTTGEIYDMYGMTAAHTTLPVPSYARVTNLANKKSVVVRVNDRGPFMHDRIIDLSYAAAYKLGIADNGSGEVEVESLQPDAVTSPIAAIEPVQSTPIETPVLSVPAMLESAPKVETKSAELNAQQNVYLQLGAFKTASSAQHFLAKMRQKLGHSAQTLSLRHQGNMVRVWLGTYSNAETARNAAEKLHGKLGVKAFVSFAK